MRTPHWRLNIFGALVFVILVGWLLIACTVRIMLDLENGLDPVMPCVGLGLGFLGLIGIGFGKHRD